jgi:hypothetical protein
MVWVFCTGSYDAKPFDIKTPASAGAFISGGETGIRTPVSFNPEHAFQACDLNHSSISPLYKRFVFG